MPRQIRCPKCGYITVAHISGNFSMPDVDDNCEFLIEQKRSKGKIDDPSCPILKTEINRVLFGHEPNPG